MLMLIEGNDALQVIFLFRSLNNIDHPWGDTRCRLCLLVSHRPFLPATITSTPRCRMRERKGRGVAWSVMRMWADSMGAKLARVTRPNLVWSATRTTREALRIMARF